MKIQYIEKTFRKSSEDVIDAANAILDEYRGQGYTLTLRQLYYQFVSRDLISNNQQSYSRLGSIISDARLAGRVSWTAIEDRGRGCNTPFIQGDVSAVLDGIEYHYSPDLWEGQEHYVEIWVEKEALANVVQRPSDRWQVPYLACKGYLSQSEAWRSSNRFREADRDGKTCHLIHLGDHDPSGIDMTRDNYDRMFLFGASVQVHRVALNFDQVEEYSPPPNPTKMTDSRAENYLAEFGHTCWELDALQPPVIEGILNKKIAEFVDPDMMEDAKTRRDEERQVLRWISENSYDVMDYARHRMENE